MKNFAIEAAVIVTAIYIIYEKLVTINVRTSE